MWCMSRPMRCRGRWFRKRGKALVYCRSSCVHHLLTSRCVRREGRSNRANHLVLSPCTRWCRSCLVLRSRPKDSPGNGDHRFGTVVVEAQLLERRICWPPQPLRHIGIWYCQASPSASIAAQGSSYTGRAPFRMWVYRRAGVGRITKDKRPSGCHPEELPR